MAVIGVLYLVVVRFGFNPIFRLMHMPFRSSFREFMEARADETSETRRK
jgi:hypothetical protein